MAVDKNGKKLPAGITQRPDGRYMGRFQYNGQQYTIYHKTSVKQLQKAINDMKYELEHGLYANSKDIAVNEWFKMWMSEYKENTLKQSTFDMYCTYYNLYIKKSIGKILLQNLKPIHIQKIYNDMAKKGKKENTIKKVNIVINGMLNQAVRNEIIVKNPCISVEVPKSEKKERRVLSQREQDEFLSFVRNSEKWKRYNTLFTVALGTGLRIGELLALNWSDIDFKNSIIRVSKTVQYLKNNETGSMEAVMQTPKTKTSKREIPLLDSISAILRKYKIEQQQLKWKLGDKWKPLEKDGFRDLVFTTEFGKPIDRSNVPSVIRRILKDLNKDRKEGVFEVFTPHSLRHTFATRCFENGIPPKVVQGYLGHSTIQMTMDLYTHVMKDVQQDEIKKIDKLFKMVYIWESFGFPFFYTLSTQLLHNFGFL